MSGAADDRTERAKREYMARLAVRMDEERAAGTVFFCGPLESKIWELKTTPDGGIVCIRSQPIGENFTEHRAYKIRRLDGWELKGSKLVLSGDFLYDSGEWIYGIRPWRARLVSRRISVTGPFTDSEMLAHALDALVSDSNEGGSGIGGRLRGLLRREVAEPAAGVALTPAAIPAAIMDSAAYTTAPCVVTRFEETGGKHRPVFEFTAPDGRTVRAVDNGPAVEDVHDECTAARIVNWSMPRDATARYRRSDPTDCGCTLL